MSHEITTSEKLDRLPWSIATNAVNTIFVQFTYFGSAFVLFLDALNFSKSQVGFLLSLLEFASLIALFVAPWVERVGFKRAYIRAFGLRTLVTAGLLLIPWIITYGSQTTFVFVTAVIALFSILRSIGVTAFYPWAQEYVPNAVRGRFSASNNLITALVGFIAVAIAGTILDKTSGFNGYLILFGVAVVFGMISLWTASHRPGGAPAPKDETAKSSSRDIKDAIRDRDYIRYLVGVGLMTFAIVPLNSFVPLYLQEQVGISVGGTVFVQTGILIGALISTTFWGWAADRYGSRPIMLVGTVIWALLPICWIIIPRNEGLGFYIALAIAFAQGAANMGWVIGGQRLLFNRIVPPEKKIGYLALYATWTGLTGGLSLLAGGLLVQVSAGLSGKFSIFILDPFTGLFLIGFLLMILSIQLLRAVQGDAQFTLDEFANLFLHGNPFMAVTSMIRHHLTNDERGTIVATTRLAETRSPLVVEELLESLNDPRLGVRMEAVIAISHTQPDPRLTEALTNLLPGTELALSVVAAWALGRLGDPSAIAALQESLNSPYYMIQAYAARALGALGDHQSAPVFLERLRDETDKGVQMAYAAALGKLKAREAAGLLLETLQGTQNQGARLELALSLARLVGDEEYFIKLLYQTRAATGTGTALSQNINVLRKKIEKNQYEDDLHDLLLESGDAFAREDLDRGVIALSYIIQIHPQNGINPHADLILQACASHFEEGGAAQIEYILLALHTLNAVWASS
ncbi:MAG: MFS transporter [Anaerolineales bacterium]|nr:MFS transporter [Anaerolineales bacterium]